MVFSRPHTQNRGNRAKGKKLPVPFVINLLKVDTIRINPQSSSHEKHVVVNAPVDMKDSFETTYDENMKTPKSSRVFFFVGPRVHHLCN